MSPINSLVSDLELHKELVDCLKNRSLEQKFLYLNDGATVYYQASIRTSDDFSEGQYYELFTSQFNKKRRVALVSLGCGNAAAEHNILQRLQKDGYNFTYFGVDSSRQMLDLAVKNLSDLECERQFLCADIAEESFRDEISQLTNNFDCRMFLFFGGTIGNVNQTNIIDSLYNILKKDDLLLVNVRVRQSLDNSEDLKVFNFYTGYLNSPQFRPFLLEPIIKLGIDPSYGDLVLEMVKEKSIGTLLMKFLFAVNKKIVIKVRDEAIHILPEEKIELLNIRVYHPSVMENFFKEHNFKLVKEIINNQSNIGFFIYKKV